MSISIEIVCAWPERAMLFKVRVEEGATVADAIAASGARVALGLHGDLTGRVGIYGRLVDLQQSLRGGDRIEIYRPLLADPKETRRLRAKKG